jgi:phosphatidylinositol N-acetylglucosaminyltransferase subunit H
MSHFLHSESVVVIPPHGVQLETHRGLPSWPLMSSRRFIPMISLHDFVINEGLHRWNVRFYLAAIKLSGEEVSLQVAYEVCCYQTSVTTLSRHILQNILPHFPVLVEVYRGVQESLFFPETDVGVASDSE